MHQSHQPARMDRLPGRHPPTRPDPLRIRRACLTCRSVRQLLSVPLGTTLPRYLGLHVRQTAGASLVLNISGCCADPMLRIMDIHPGTLRPADRIPRGKTLVTSRLAVGHAEAGQVCLLQSEAGGDLLGMLAAASAAEVSKWRWGVVESDDAHPPIRSWLSRVLPLQRVRRNGRSTVGLSSPADGPDQPARGGTARAAGWFRTDPPAEPHELANRCRTGPFVRLPGRCPSRCGTCPGHGWRTPPDRRQGRRPSTPRPRSPRAGRCGRAGIACRCRG